MPVYTVYIDESYDDKKFCLSGLAIRHDKWHECMSKVRAMRRDLKTKYGIFIRKEIHARDFVAGRGQISDRVIGKHTRSRIFHSLLTMVASLPGVHIFNICLEKNKDAELTAWDRLINRLERTLRRYEEEERKSRLVNAAELPSCPPFVSNRLQDYHPRAILIADEGRQNEITKVYRKMTVYNPVPSKFGSWGSSTSKNLPIERIIEDPIFKPSHHSFFIQLADCISFSLLKREVPPTPNIAKYGIHKFFDECLSNRCFKEASPRDPLGIVRK